MKNLADEIEKLILESLKKTVPAEAKKAAKNIGPASNEFIDDSTAVMGFKKITKKGYTP